MNTSIKQIQVEGKKIRSKQEIDGTPQITIHSIPGQSYKANKKAKENTN